MPSTPRTAVSVVDGELKNVLLNLAHRLFFFQIYYRPLYSMGDFTIRFAGNELYYLVENLDVITYYAFRIGTNDSSGNLLFCEVLARTLSDGE